MRVLLFLLTCSLLPVCPALADDGQIHVKSSHSVQLTADRLESVLLNAGMKIFARIDHAAGADSVGLKLRPTELLIFGNPKVGTPLMQCQQSLAIDLPQKTLVWQDAAGQVWLTYNDPRYLGRRHALGDCGEPVLGKVSVVLANFSRLATAP